MIVYDIRREKRKKYLFIIPLLLFVIDYLLIYFHLIDTVDEAVYQFTQLMRCDIMTSFFKICSSLGSTYFYVGILVFLLFFNRKTLYTAGHLLIGQGLNRLIKTLVRRPRPPQKLHLVVEKNYSFPSGHSMSAMIGYGLFIIQLKHSDLKLKNILMIICGIMIFLIGLSRIYLGVHYFSDVLGGYLIGLSYLLFVYYNTSLYA